MFNEEILEKEMLKEVLALPLEQQCEIYNHYIDNDKFYMIYGNENKILRMIFELEKYKDKTVLEALQIAGFNSYSTLFNIGDINDEGEVLCGFTEYIFEDVLEDNVLFFFLQDGFKTKDTCFLKKYSSNLYHIVNLWLNALDSNN